MRLIDAYKVKCDREDFDTYADYITAFDAINEAPTVEAVPIRHGKWIYGEDRVAMCDGYRCSNCGYFVPWDYQHKFISYIEEYKYCPECGAMMDAE